MKATLVLFLFLVTSLTYAESKITLFVALSPAGSFQAVSKKAKGNLFKTGEAFSADKISVTIESFKTGIDLRDEHLWKHMNASKNPKATLTDIKGQSGKATANLEVNGVTKPVVILYKVKGEEVLANFTVKASDFGMSKAEYLGVGVDDLIKIEATFPFRVK